MRACACWPARPMPETAATCDSRSAPGFATAYAVHRHDSMQPAPVMRPMRGLPLRTA